MTTTDPGYCLPGRLAVLIDCSIPLVPALMAGKGLQFEVRQIVHWRSARNRHPLHAGQESLSDAPKALLGAK
jgi:hypothetical protein